MLMHNDMPAVSVHDLVIHPREHEALIGTHGRSLYIARVKELQQLRDTVLAKPLLHSKQTKCALAETGATIPPAGKRPATVDIPVYASAAGKAKLTLQTEKGLTLREWEADCRKGLNYIAMTSPSAIKTWKLTING